MNDAENLVVLYRARDLIEAQTINSALQDAGVFSRVEGEYLGTALGDLPYGPSTAPRVVVSQAQAAQAQLVLDAWLSGRNEELGSTPTDSAEPMVEESSAISEVIVPPRRSNREIWWEILAVSAIGILPNLASSIHGNFRPTPFTTSWSDAWFLLTNTGCILFATLYLISRSGESWEAFGFTRLRFVDAKIIFVLLLMTEIVWRMTADFYAEYAQESLAFQPAPASTSLSAFYVLTYFVSAASEEVVMRAYLLTRLSALWQSGFAAAVVSSVLFAAYHSYQGFASVAMVFLFGLLYSLAFLMYRRVWPLAVSHALANCLIHFASA